MFNLTLIVLGLSGCQSKVKVGSITDMQRMKEVKEVSIYDCFGLRDNENYPIDPVKWKDGATTEPNEILRIMKAIQLVQTNQINMSPIMNLLCFTSKKGEIICTDINFNDTIYGSDYTDNGSLKQALEDIGMMPLEIKE